MRRIVVFGNSGSGKTTLARVLTSQYGLAHLDLDSLAWDSSGVQVQTMTLDDWAAFVPRRRSLTESARTIRDFIHEHSEWVIEGCYGDLLEHVLPYASEVRFLNPGVEACIANCRARPWEPEKYPSKEAQDQKLDFLLDWVREYETRDDEYGLKRHRQVFDRFPGRKREYTSVECYSDG